MATNFPTSLQDLDATRGTSTQALSSPSHVTHHQTEDDTIEALQAKVGVDNSAVTTSLDYKLKNSSSVSPGHKHTLTSTDFTDVDVTTPADGQVLTYSSSSSKWVNSATSAPNASTTVAGVVEVATQAERDARTATGGTGATLVADPSTQRAVLSHDYIASATGNDSYAITCTPAVSAYTTGDVYRFKADVANTGACSLNVNSLGAKSLKMNSNLDPVDGYIKAGSIVECHYDGTNMQIMSVSGKPSVSQTGEELYAADGGANDTYAITLTPAPTAYVTGMVVRFKANTANTGTATLNVNSLGAKTIVKGLSTTLDTGDIVAGQLLEVIYDGTNFVLLCPTAAPFRGLTAAGSTTKDLSDANTTQTIAHGLGVAPKIYQVQVMRVNSAGVFGISTSFNANSIGMNMASGGVNNHTTFVAGGSSTNNQNDYQTGTITVDATNISIAWVKTGSPTGTANIIWTAFA